MILGFYLPDTFCSWRFGRGLLILILFTSWDVISGLGPFMIFISGSWEVVGDDPVNDGLAIGAI